MNLNKIKTEMNKFFTFFPALIQITHMVNIGLWQFNKLKQNLPCIRQFGKPLSWYVFPIKWSTKHVKIKVFHIILYLFIKMIFLCMCMYNLGVVIFMRKCWIFSTWPNWSYFSILVRIYCMNMIKHYHCYIFACLP